MIGAYVHNSSGFHSSFVCFVCERDLWNVLDITNTIIAAVVVHYFFDFAGVIIYLPISIIVLMIEYL